MFSYFWRTHLQTLFIKFITETLPFLKTSCYSTIWFEIHPARIEPKALRKTRHKKIQIEENKSTTKKLNFFKDGRQIDELEERYTRRCKGRGAREREVIWVVLNCRVSE